jgi:hypothetical protein
MVVFSFSFLPSFCRRNLQKTTKGEKKKNVIHSDFHCSLVPLVAMADILCCMPNGCANPKVGLGICTMLFSFILGLMYVIPVVTEQMLIDTYIPTYCSFTDFDISTQVCTISQCNTAGQCNIINTICYNCIFNVNTYLSTGSAIPSSVLSASSSDQLNDVIPVSTTYLHTSGQITRRDDAIRVCQSMLATSTQCFYSYAQDINSPFTISLSKPSLQLSYIPSVLFAIILAVGTIISFRCHCKTPTYDFRLRREVTEARIRGRERAFTPARWGPSLGPHIDSGSVVGPGGEVSDEVFERILRESLEEFQRTMQTQQASAASNEQTSSLASVSGSNDHSHSPPSEEEEVITENIQRSSVEFRVENPIQRVNSHR